MPIVDFTANNGTRLELTGYTIKNVEFIPEQEMSSIENTQTLIDPNDGITIIGIQKNIIHTVTIKLIPNIKKVDVSNANEIRKATQVHVEKSPRNRKKVGKGNTKKQTFAKETEKEIEEIKN